MIEVLIVDDNPIVRAALRQFLSMSPDVRVIGEASDGESAVDLTTRLHPDVALLDHRMPIADGLSVIGRLSAHTIVLVLTSDADEALITGMLRGGARGYLVHGEFEPDELLRAVRAVHEGKNWLSPAVAAVTISALIRQDQEQATPVAWGARTAGLTRREEEVLEQVCAGLPNAAIGRRLLVSEKTVKNHLNHVFAKLQVSNRTEAAQRWRELTAGS